jgi:diguanylate cyclase (GGDEF)-like protein/PAS domain S-box-containing protein
MLSLKRRLERFAQQYSPANLLIALSCLALVVVAASLTLRRVAFERDLAIANEMKKNSNLALALEEQTIRTLKAIDQVVLFVRHQYREKGLKLDIRQLIANGEIDDSTFNDVSIIDEEGFRAIGRVNVGQRPINVQDRDYFKSHFEHAEDQLLISRPEMGRLTGKWAIHLTRRINKHDGSFGGIVVISLDPSYFLRFYEQADLGHDGVVGLVGLDGIVRARYARGHGTFGDDVRGLPLMSEQKKTPVGTFVGNGAVDGVPRYISYRTLPEYPLIVMVGTSQQEALAGFYKYERDYYFLILAVATALVAFFATVWIGALSRQRAALESLSRTETLFRATCNQAAVGIARFDLEGRFVQVNPALCRMLGYSEEELLERTVADVTYADDQESLDDLRQKRLATPMPASSPDSEKRYKRSDGSALWVVTAVTLVRDPAGNPDYFVSVVQDITKRKELQERLLYQANYDGLTRLPNRMLFYERTRQTLSLAQRKHRVAGVLFIDLDRFKEVNDTFGHEAGDELLKHVAQCVAASVRLEDTMGRLGGDEFAVTLSELGDEQDAARVAQKIIDALGQPFALLGQDVFVTSSIGIAMFPADGEDAESLVKHADAAMLRAKAAGRNNFQFYTSEMNEFKAERIQLEADLRRALQRDEFLLYFQPKTSLRGGDITGVEALLRWRHPQKGIVLPGEFIPMLEESGLIGSVGEWVLNGACKQIHAWLEMGVAPVPIAINLSARQFQDRDLSGTIARALRRYDVDAAFLEVEITESAAMHNADHTIATLDKLKKQRVKIAIDDFGTGYSSLNYLQRFPLDALKLDRTFVSGLPADVHSASIALAVITMSHSLGLRVIAEGVETADQRSFLNAHGCDEIQGDCISPALPADDCTELIRRHRAGASDAPPGSARRA